MARIDQTPGVSPPAPRPTEPQGAATGVPPIAPAPAAPDAPAQPTGALPGDATVAPTGFRVPDAAPKAPPMAGIAIPAPPAAAASPTTRSLGAIEAELRRVVDDLAKATDPDEATALATRGAALYAELSDMARSANLDLETAAHVAELGRALRDAIAAVGSLLDKKKDEEKAQAKEEAKKAAYRAEWAAYWDAIAHMAGRQRAAALRILALKLVENYQAKAGVTAAELQVNPLRALIAALEVPKARPERPPSFNG